MREAVTMEPVTMENVLEKENLNTAWRQVRSNDGAAGVDGLDIRASEGHIREHWEQIEAALLAGHYQPEAVRAVEIPKANGGVRMLGVPCAGWVTIV